MLCVVLHGVVRHVNSGPARKLYKHKPYPPLLCMQFDSQWDTHPDNSDQYCFIKPSMRWGGDQGGRRGGVGAPSANSVTLAWGVRGGVRFSREKTEESILRTGGIQ